MADEMNQLLKAVNDLSGIWADYKKLIIENAALKKQVERLNKLHVDHLNSDFDNSEELWKMREKLEGLEAAYHSLEIDYKHACEELQKKDPKNPRGAGRKSVVTQKQIELINKRYQYSNKSMREIAAEVKLSPSTVQRIIKKHELLKRRNYNVDDFAENAE